MKSRFIRIVSASFFCLCVLPSLIGCIELAIHPMAREWKKQQEEQMRRIAEEQKQLQLKQQQYAQQQSPPEQEKVKVHQIGQSPKPKEPSIVKEQEQRKTESVGQVRNTDITLDWSKLIGKFEEGHTTKPDRIHAPSTCLQGNCTDESAYVGDFKKATLNGATSDEGERAYKSGDYSTALRVFRPLAAQGDAKAQSRLGNMYSKGNGVPQDYGQSAVWFHKSADQGFAKAQHNLGVLYEQGLGVGQDYAQAAFWYHKAAEQGLDASQVNLGILYEKGLGVGRDYAQAAFWYRKAANQGAEDAQQYLNTLPYNIGVGLYNGLVGGGTTSEPSRNTSSDKESERVERMERSIRRHEERARQEDLKKQQEDARRYNEKETDPFMKIRVPEHP